MNAGERVRYDGRCRGRAEAREGVDPVVRFKNPLDGEVVVNDQVRGRVIFENAQLDDLIIASFVTGPGAVTLPILIYSRIRLGLRPDINALATIIILVVAIGVLVAAWIMFRQQKQRELELSMSEEA